MRDSDRGDVVGAQQRERTKNVLMLQRVRHVGLHQTANEQIDEALGLDGSAFEGDVHLLLDLEAPGDARDHRLILALPTRHLLQQRGHEA